MYSAVSSIAKNFILIGLVALSAVNFYYNILSWQDLLAVQSLAGLAYVFLSCYEFLNAQYKAMLPVQRFSYFTNSYVMFKVLKISIFLGFAVVLFFAGNRIKYLYPICLIIAFTEALVMALKYKRGVCFVSIYANYLLFSQDRLVKLFASEIESIEFRHDIFYFVKKDRKTMQVKLVHIEARENFVLSINEWIKRNKIKVSQESEQKLADLVSGNRS